MNLQDPQVVDLINTAAFDCVKAILAVAFLMPTSFAIFAIIKQLKGK